MVGSDVAGFKGLDLVEALDVRASDGEQREIRVDGVFLAIGWTPNTGVLDLAVEKTTEGYLKTDARLMTSFQDCLPPATFVIRTCGRSSRPARMGRGPPNSPPNSWRPASCRWAFSLNPGWNLAPQKQYQ